MDLGRNIATTLVTRMCVLALALVSSVVLARILGPERRGLFALVVLLPELASAFGNLGFQASNAVFAGLEPESRPGLAWQSVGIATVLGALCFLGGYFYLKTGILGARAIAKAPIWMYMVSLTTVPMILLIDYWNSLVRGMNKITTNNVIEVSQKIGSLLLLVLFVGVFRRGVGGAVWADWVYNLGIVALLVRVLRNLHMLGRPTFDAALLRRTGRFAGAAYIGGILTYLNYRVDQIIIAFMLPTAQLAFYAVAVAIAERIWIPTGAVATALLPHLTAKRDRDPMLAAVIARHVAILTGIACLLIAVSASLGIRVLYGTPFLPAVAPLQWLLPGILVLSVSKVLVAELSARKKINYSIWTVAVASVINVAGNLVLLPRFGITGASIASSISYTVLAVLITFYYVHETKISWKTLVPTLNDLAAYLILLRKRDFQKFAEAISAGHEEARGTLDVHAVT